MAGGAAPVSAVGTELQLCPLLDPFRVELPPSPQANPPLAEGADPPVSHVLEHRKVDSPSSWCYTLADGQGGEFREVRTCDQTVARAGDFCCATWRPC